MSDCKHGEHRYSALVKTCVLGPGGSETFTHVMFCASCGDVRDVEPVTVQMLPIGKMAQ